MTDTITFGPLDTIAVDATIEGVLRVGGEAYGAAPGAGIVSGALVLDGHVEATVTLVIAPAMPAAIDGALVFAGDAHGTTREFGDTDGALRLGGDAWPAADIGTVDAYADGGLRLAGEVISALDLSAYGFLVERPYLMAAYGGLTWDVIGDEMRFVDTQPNRHTSVIASGLALAQRLGARFDGHHRLRDTLRLDDRLASIVHLLMHTALQLGDDMVISSRAVQVLVDRLVLDGTVAHAGEAHQLVADAIAFATSLDPFLHEALLDGLALSASVADRIEAAERWVDTLVLDAVAPGTATFTVLLRDGMAVGAETLTGAEVHTVMQDALGFVIRIALDDGQYVAWVMDTETKALTRYTQFPFNSFMRLGGHVYGVTDSGLYRLGGDTDAGEPIPAQVRRGLSDLGTRVLKRAPAFYLGYSSRGELRIKAVVVGADGEREAHVYALKPRDAANARVARAPLGRGLCSTYWDFVIENADGADFDVDVFELESMLLARRVRGDTAGRG